MMAVVSLISICAALATPSVIHILNDSRSQRDSMSVLTLLQDARSRALGNGGAVVLEFVAPVNNTQGTLLVREVRQDIDGDAVPDLPDAECSGPFVQTVKSWTGQRNQGQTAVQLDVCDGTGACQLNAGNTRFCFTPRGRLFLQNAGIWTAQEGLVTFRFGNDIKGANARQIDLFPGGTSRLHL